MKTSGFKSVGDWREAAKRAGYSVPHRLSLEPGNENLSVQELYDKAKELRAVAGAKK